MVYLFLTKAKVLLLPLIYRFESHEMQLLPAWQYFFIIMMEKDACKGLYTSN